MFHLPRPAYEYFTPIYKQVSICRTLTRCVAVNRQAADIFLFVRSILMCYFFITQKKNPKITCLLNILCRRNQNVLGINI